MSTFAGGGDGDAKCKATDKGHRPNSQNDIKVHNLYLPFFAGSEALAFLVPRNWEKRVKTCARNIKK